MTEAKYAEYQHNPYQQQQQPSCATNAGQCSYQGQPEQGSYQSQGQLQGQPGQSFMVHPGLGKVQGPAAEGEGENGKEVVPYPVYVRPYDDELPQVTWKKNPAEPFGTLTIVKGEDKMIVKVPMKNDRILPRTNYPVEVGSVMVFAAIAVIMWMYF